MIEKPNTLLMYSGGLDSTGAFYKMLRDGRKLHVHHMNLQNIEHRAKAESHSVHQIIQYMKSLGDFNYSESTHAYPCFNNRFIWDSDIISFVAGNICMQCPWIEEVALGMVATDESECVSERIERANKVFYAFTASAKKVYPVRELTKQQIYDLLPDQLRKLTWSCRTPTYNSGVPNACNKCQTCQEIHKLTKI